MLSGMVRRLFQEGVNTSGKLRPWSSWTANSDKKYIRRLYTLAEYIWRVSGKSCSIWDWASATLYIFAESSQFWHTTRGDSQAKHETLWLVHHRPLKQWDLNEARHERRGYTRGSKARWVFPSTFSLSPCLGFPRRECTPGNRVKWSSIECKQTMCYFLENSLSKR